MYNKYKKNIMEVKKVQSPEKWSTTSTNENSFSETYTHKIRKTATHRDQDLSFTYTLVRPRRYSYRTRSNRKTLRLSHLNSSKETSLAWTHPFPHRVESQKSKPTRAHLSTSHDTTPAAAAFPEADGHQTVRVASRPGSFFLTYQAPASLVPHPLFRYLSFLRPTALPPAPGGDAAGPAIPLQHVLRLSRRGPSSGGGGLSPATDPSPGDRDGAAEFTASLELPPSPPSSPHGEGGGGETKRTGTPAAGGEGVSRPLRFRQRATRGDGSPASPSPRRGHRGSPTAQNGIYNGKNEERADVKVITEGVIHRRPPLQRLGEELRQWRASLYEFKLHLIRKNKEILGEGGNARGETQERSNGGSISRESSGLNTEDEGALAVKEIPVEKVKIAEDTRFNLSYDSKNFSSTMYTQELFSLTDGNLYASGNNYNGGAVEKVGDSSKGQTQPLRGNDEESKYFVVFSSYPKEHRWWFLRGVKWNFSILRHVLRIEIHPVSESMSKVA